MSSPQGVKMYREKKYFNVLHVRNNYSNYPSNVSRAVFLSIPRHILCYFRHHNIRKITLLVVELMYTINDPKKVDVLYKISSLLSREHLSLCKICNCKPRKTDED